MGSEQVETRAVYSDSGFAEFLELLSQDIRYNDVSISSIDVLEWHSCPGLKAKLLSLKLKFTWS